MFFFYRNKLIIHFVLVNRYSVLQVNDSLIERQNETLLGLAYYIANGVHYFHI